MCTSIDLCVYSDMSDTSSDMSESAVSLPMAPSITHENLYSLARPSGYMITVGERGLQSA